jgi:hypothetical protein
MSGVDSHILQSDNHKSKFNLQSNLASLGEGLICRDILG